MIKNHICSFSDLIGNGHRNTMYMSLTYNYDISHLMKLIV